MLVLLLGMLSGCMVGALMNYRSSTDIICLQFAYILPITKVSNWTITQNLHMVMDIYSVDFSF